MEEFIELFWVFMLGSFCGFIIETIWCMIKLRKVESRKGLIYGHLIPIYGIAGLFIAVVMELFHIKKWYLMFLVTFVISGLVEYFSSLFQEKILGTVSWDYSNINFNLNGRINLLYLCGFSIFGVLWCKYYRTVIAFLDRLMDNRDFLYFGTIICFIFMVYNAFISFVAGYRQKERRAGKMPRNKFEIWLDNKYTDEYLKKIYANAVVVEK